MIQKFVTILRRVRHELLDLNHTSRINKLVSLEIPMSATELAAGTDANFGIGTLGSASQYVLMHALTRELSIMHHTFLGFRTSNRGNVSLSETPLRGDRVPS
jgi:hypothetical protein